MSKCKEEGCKTIASFGVTKGEPLYCKKHKLAVMIDVKNRVCTFEGCTTTCPAFGIQGGIGTHCKKHKSDTMIDVKTKRCESKGCESLAPIFNIKGETKGRYCRSHKLDGMVDVKHKYCEIDQCINRRNFGKKGGKGQYCSNHKTNDMVNVSSKYCEYDGCNSVSPSFDTKGGKGRYCNKHKTDGMIDVSHKQCQYKECSLQPSFGEKGGKAQFCKTHKSETMIDIKNKRCNKHECSTIASFGIGRDSKLLYCSKHRTEEMINIKIILCDHDLCTRGATHGKPGIPESKCTTHRLPGMIRRSKSKCKTVNCKEIAIWGTNWIPKHCEPHKVEGEQNLIENPCISCGLMYILDINNRCESCNPISFATVRLAKQNALMNYLDSRDLKGSTTDTIVDNGLCGKERPDRVYDFGDKIVILECDEHQHRDRQCSCEQIRMVNLGQAYGGMPVYFIRWNPDDYSPENTKKEPEAISKRHKAVGDFIADIQSGKYTLPLALVSAFYMYYDGWSLLTDESWKIISTIEI